MPNYVLCNRSHKRNRNMVFIILTRPSMTEYLIPRIQESSRITWPLTLTLTLSTPLMHAYPETIVCKFGRAIRPFAWEKKRFSCLHKIARITCPLSLTLILSTPWMKAYLLTIVCKFGGDRAICLGEEAIFVPAQKCPYHVTLDLDLDLEHTLDARWSGVHLVKVWWRYGHLPGRRSDLRKSLQTDGQTDDGRLAIA